MTDLRRCFLIFFLLFLSSPSAPASWTSLHSQTDGRAVNLSFLEHSNFHEEEDQGLTVQIDVSGFEWEVIRAADEDFVRITLPDETGIGETGRPDLPEIHRLFAIPDRKGVRAEILSAEWLPVALPQSRVAPYQESESDYPICDPTYYSADKLYPEKAIYLGEPVIMRDLRLMRLAYCPFRYNPNQEKLEVCRSLILRLHFEGEDQHNPKYRSANRISRDFDRVYASLIPNYPYLDQTWEISEGSYLVICPDQSETLTILEPLLDWKRRKGHDVVLETFPSGYSSYQIKGMIQEAYDSWDEPPTYVLLIGDSYGSLSLPAWSPGGIDHPYSQLEGGDILADVCVGRLPAETNAELAVMVNKIYHYEEDPYLSQTSWYPRALMIAGSASSGTSTIQTKRWVKDRLLSVGYSQIDTMWYNMPGSVTYQISSSINAGVTYFNYRGFYGMSGWSNALTDALTNGYKLPIVTTLTCGTGGFDGQSIMEHFVVSSASPANLRGAVASIGTATTNTHTRFNNCVDQGIYWGLVDEGIHRLGAALVAAKLLLYQNYPNDPGNVSNFTNWNALAGDPGLEVWLGIPQQLEVVAPSSISLGQNWLDVTVRFPGGSPVEDAWVSLYREGQVAVSGHTDSQGQVSLLMDSQPTGPVNLTVTGHNLRPYRSTIAVQQQNLYVGYLSHQIDDDAVGESSGDGDGQVNPGETIEIPVTLKNYGTVGTASSVQAVISTSDSLVTLTDSVESFPDIPPGSSALSLDDFGLNVASNAPDGHSVQLELSVTVSGGGPFASGLSFTVVAPAFQFADYSIAGGSLEPGSSADLFITIENQGHRVAQDVVGNLSTSDPFLIIEEDQAEFGSFVIGGTGSNVTPFQLNVHPLTIPGHQSFLTLELEDASGIVDTVAVILTLGTVASTDPVGPDAYGYYCFDNTDLSYQQAPVYDWVEIDPHYGGSGTLISLSDYGDQQDDTEIVPLPFTFRYYGQEYVQISVCSNGWLIMGANTAFNYFRNWMIPSGMGPDAMIAPFWDDLMLTAASGVYYWYDPGNGRFIIQWSHLQNRGTPSPLETFQIILYDPEFQGTPTGDGDILFQYQQVQQVYGYSSDNPYASIGIESPDQMTGVQVSYMNQYPAGIAPLQELRAYLFTTDVAVLQGSIEGEVTDLETGQPISGAQVYASGTVYETQTDSLGYFRMDDIFVGTYDFTAEASGYNDLTLDQVTITMDSVVSLDFALTHPEIALDTTQISVILQQGSSAQVPFHIINEGNGPLDYWLELTFEGGSGSDALWDPAFSYPAQQLCGDDRLFGVEFVGAVFYVSGGNGSSEPNLIHRFDRDGNYLGSFEQPGSTAPYGYRDLASDGETLFGSEGGDVVRFSTEGQELERIPGPLNPNRALAYDPQTQHLWAADILSPIYEITLDGTVMNVFSNSLHIYGLAWHPEDPDGRNLYIFSQDGSDPKLRVSRMDPQTGAVSFCADLAGPPSEYAGGLAITPNWNPLIWTLVTLIQGPQDRLAGWELNYNTLWITFEPSSGEVPAGSQETITLTFDSGDLDEAQYWVNLQINHNAAGPALLLPLSMEVQSLGVASGSDIDLPDHFTLSSIYPNPFNPTAIIRYGLPVPAEVSLAVFDLLGRRLAENKLGRIEAGWHKAEWTASDAASGIYILQLRAGSEVLTDKCILIK